MSVVIDIVRQPAVLDSPAGEGRVTEAVSRREDPELVDERPATLEPLLDEEEDVPWDVSGQAAAHYPVIFSTLGGSGLARSES